MSEEMIKNLIARLNHNCSNACLNDASSCICTVNDIKDLIHLYNKEKEKNKEYEEGKTLSKKQEKMVIKIIKEAAEEQITKEIKNFISKNKISELIKDYTTPKQNGMRRMDYDDVLPFLNKLEELLEE